ncbi:MAG: YibE/F family protein [Lachnospiraceae bacterium]|nr:YibE/F family protein [Lachnospiraceae bacterium]
MRNKVISQFGKYFIVIGIILGITVFNQSIEKQPLLADDNTEYVKAVVTESSSENLQTGTGEDFGSSQEVTLLIKSGSHKGEYVEAYSLNGYLYGANCTVGTKVIAQLSEYDGTLSASVYNYDREFEITVLILLFLGVMWLVGGKKGINSIIALIFTFIIVIMLYVPLMYIGVSPFLAAVISVILITVITHILLADLEMKSISAMLGTICGVVVAGIIALIFGKAANVNGYNVQEIETLVFIGQGSELNVGGMLFSGILISSLGAVMDVAMSVSSSLNEIQLNRPDIRGKELFKSGINIGRDMIGTMSNTLILAYVGSSINLIMIIYAYSYQMHQVLNMYSIAIELMSGIAGTMGIILAVPFTSFITALLLRYKKAV